MGLHCPTLTTTYMIPRVIGLVGPAGAGKDTVASMLQTGWDYTPIALATPIKTFVDDLLGPGKHRRAYQLIGDVIRGENPHAFIHVVQKVLNWDGRRWVITDIRYPNELEAFRVYGPLWYVETPPAVRQARLKARDGSAGHLAHASEAVEPLRALCDVMIANAGSKLELADEVGLHLRWQWKDSPPQ